MKRTLFRVVKLLQKEARCKKFQIRAEETDYPNLVFLTSEKSKKIIALGIERDRVVGTQFCAYLVNFKTIYWAQEEGFSPDEIADKLTDEVFTKISIDKITKMLSS